MVHDVLCETTIVETFKSTTGIRLINSTDVVIT